MFSLKIMKKCKIISLTSQFTSLTKKIKSLQSLSLTFSQDLISSSASVLSHASASLSLSASVSSLTFSAWSKKVTQSKKTLKSKILEWKKTALTFNSESICLASKFLKTQSTVLAEYIELADTQAVYKYFHHSAAATEILKCWCNAQNSRFDILNKSKSLQWTSAQIFITLWDEKMSLTAADFVRKLLMISKITDSHCRYMTWYVMMCKLMKLNSALFIDSSTHKLAVIHDCTIEDWYCVYIICRVYYCAQSDVHTNQIDKKSNKRQNKLTIPLIYLTDEDLCSVTTEEQSLLTAVDLSQFLSNHSEWSDKSSENKKKINRISQTKLQKQKMQDDKFNVQFSNSFCHINSVTDCLNLHFLWLNLDSVMQVTMIVQIAQKMHILYSDTDSLNFCELCSLKKHSAVTHQLTECAIAEEVLGDAEEIQQTDKNIFWELQHSLNHISVSALSYEDVCHCLSLDLNQLCFLSESVSFFVSDSVKGLKCMQTSPATADSDTAAASYDSDKLTTVNMTVYYNWQWVQNSAACSYSLDK